MNKFLEWCNRNGKPIGLTIGGLNILTGVMSLVAGNYFIALIGFAIGSFLIFDAYRGGFK